MVNTASAKDTLKSQGSADMARLAMLYSEGVTFKATRPQGGTAGQRAHKFTSGQTGRGFAVVHKESTCQPGRFAVVSNLPIKRLTRATRTG